jgi:hypothetical protein
LIDRIRIPELCSAWPPVVGAKTEENDPENFLMSKLRFLQAAKKDPYVDSTQYRQGAPAARDNAVHDYDRIRQIAPRSLEALYARGKLPRLKLGIDTHQRRFYCLYGR